MLFNDEVGAGSMAEPDEGDPAPAFALPDQDERTVRLADLLDRPTVLFFYPGDFTFGCTREAKRFQDNLAAFQQRDVNLVGISTDPPGKHRRFREQYGLTFDLLSDVDGEARQAYGVEGLLGTQRVTFVIDEEGTIRRRYRSLFPGSHVDEALEAIQGGLRP